MIIGAGGWLQNALPTADALDSTCDAELVGDIDAETCRMDSGASGCHARCCEAFVARRRQTTGYTNTYWMERAGQRTGPGNVAQFSACRRHGQEMLCAGGWLQDALPTANALDSTCDAELVGGIDAETCLMDSGASDCHARRCEVFTACRRQAAGYTNTDWLESAEQWIASLVRSAALCSMFALWRLLAYAVPKKGGDRNCDNLVAGFRAATRWAPIALIYVACLPGVHCATPEFWSEIMYMDLNIQLAESVTRNPVLLERAPEPEPPPRLHRRAERLDADPGRPWFEDQDGEQTSPDELPTAPWHATAVIYGLQTTPEVITFWVDGDLDEHAITNAATDEAFHGLDDHMVFPLRPQPCDDCLHYVSVTTWVMGLGMLPIVIDAKQCRGTRFVAHVGAEITKEDIQRLLGPDWPQNADVWPPRRSTPLVDDETVRVNIGWVFIVSPRHASAPDWEPYASKIRHPWTWSRDVAAMGMPRFDRGLNNLQILGNNTWCRIVHHPRCSFAELKRFVARVCGFTDDDICLCTPSRFISHYEARGRRCPDQIGVKTVEQDRMRGVFLDPREVGSEVLFMCLPPQAMTIEQICSRAEVPLPSGWRVDVRGAVYYSPNSGTVTFGERTVLTLAVRPFQPWGAAHLQRGSSPGSDSEDGQEREGSSNADDGSRTGAELDFTSPSSDESRSRSPRRGADGGGVGASDGSPAVLLPLQSDHSDSSATAEDGQTVLDAEKGGERFVKLSQSILDLASCRKKRNIALAELVGPHMFNLERGALSVTGDFDAVYRMQARWTDFRPLPQLRGLPMKPCTERALGRCRTVDCGAIASDGWRCSIYADGSAKKGTSGWGAAIILQQPDSQQDVFVGVFGSAIEAPGCGLNLGEMPGDSLQAEQVGLIWSLAWALQETRGLGLQLPIDIFFDNMSAGSGMNGESNLPGESALSHMMRGLKLLTEQIAEMDVQMYHVKSHAGHPWNELADVVAKAAAGIVNSAGCCIPAPPPVVAQYLRSINWQWAWLSRSPSDAEGLCFERNWLTWGPITGTSALHPEDLIPFEPDACGNLTIVSDASIRVFSCNVQSLHGKHKYLEEQFSYHAADVCMLQETKQKGGFCETARYLRFESESEGHWGVAIWVSKTITTQEGTVHVTRTDVTLVVSEPRIITVKVNKAHFRVLLLSVHVPQQGRPQAERDAVFHQLRRVVDAHGKAAAVIAGIDSNSRVPVEHLGVTGDLAFGDTDLQGWEFAEILSCCDLWLPSTWQMIHKGQDATWAHCSGSESRIDFVAVGGYIKHQGMASRVACEIDLLTPHQDHWCVQLDITVQSYRHDEHPGRIRRPRYDRQKIMSEEGRRILKEELAKKPKGDWSLHPDMHAKLLEDAIKEILHEHFIKAPDGPRALYIRDDVWRMRALKLGVKRRHRHKRQGLVQLIQGAALQTWKLGTGLLPGISRKLSLLGELIGAAISFCTSWMKRRIRVDKQEAMGDFLKTLGGLPASQMQRALGDFGIGGKFRKRGRPVPHSLRARDGRLVNGREELDALWMEHFGRMEHGRVMDTSTFLRQSPDVEFLADHLLEVQAIPTKMEIEGIFRKVPVRKAMGLDLIPSEVFKAAPKQMTEFYYGLYLKCALFARTPIQWAGGILQEAYKNSGCISQPDSYRSLYLASQPGKLYQKAIRQKLGGLMQRQLHPLHCGPKQGAPVTLPAMAVHRLNCLFKAKGVSAAIFCLDTKSAYYRTIRQLAVGQLNSEEETVRLFQEFGLDPGDYHEFLELTSRGGAVGEAGASSHLLALSQDLYQRTWFVSNYTAGQKVCHVEAGSRPGASCADVMFAFIYGRLLSKVREEAACADFDTPLQYSGSRTLFAEPGDGVREVVRVSDATWADDSTMVTFDASPTKLMAKAVRMMEAVIHQCVRYGLVPNTKRGKSALILCLRGGGSRRLAGEVFRGDKKTVTVSTPAGHSYEVCVEASYLHLGEVLCRDASMHHEERRRTSIARASFEAARKQLLGNKHVDLHSRATIFRSLVTSTYHNLELWVTSDPAWTQLQQNYDLLTKKLLVGNYPREKVYCMSAAEAIHLTGVPTLWAQATLKRLTFLSNIVRHGGREIWAILQVEQEWARQAREDLRWVKQWAGEELPDVSAENWPLWWHILKAPTGTFKQTARRAARLFQAAEARRHSRDLFLKDLARQAGVGVRDGPCRRLDESCWCCPPCRLRFNCRAALAVHFRRKHGRVAEYRHYAVGSLCRACGTEYHTQRRLLMHLKTNGGCCDKLAAMGLRSEQPQEGIKRWRPPPGVEFVLCPPEKRQAAADVRPCSQRKWRDNQHMEPAFWKAMDWLVEYGGNALEEVRCAMTACLQPFPLYKDECRLIFQRLSESARHLLEDEGMHLWAEVGATKLQNLLSDMGQSFECAAFLDEAKLPPLRRTLEAWKLREVSTWMEMLPTAPAVSQLPHLYVTSTAQVTCVGTATCVYRTFRQAVQEWHEHTWTKYGKVTVDLSGYKEEGTYLEIRHADAPSLGDAPCQADLLWALRHCWKCGLGGLSVQVSAGFDFWASEISVPFRALSALQPCVSP